MIGWRSLNREPRAACFRSRRLVEGDPDMGKASLQP